jgi:(2Fe-2S) ferredoxin
MRPRGPRTGSGTEEAISKKKAKKDKKALREALANGRAVSGGLANGSTNGSANGSSNGSANGSANGHTNGSVTALLIRPESKPKKNGAKSGAKVRAHEAHVLVCKGGDCKKKGSKETQKAIKAELRERGMHRDVRMDSVDCLGMCKQGPNVIVYHGAKPGGTWYLGLKPGDAPRVVECHLEGCEPVEELAAEFRDLKK